MVLVEVFLHNGTTTIWDVEFHGVPVPHADGHHRVPLGEQPAIHRPAELPLSDDELRFIASLLLEGKDQGTVGLCRWRVKLYRHT